MPAEPNIRVTVEDLATGETETIEVRDDYVILAAGTCHVAHVQAYANGTHILTIKGRRDAR
jgi:hypothetical protein